MHCDESQRRALGRGGRAAPWASRAVAEAAVARQESRSGHAFNAAQRETTVALLTGTDRVALVQGYAGTAKTTSVLAATADELRQQGWKVEALAPTRQAAETLGRAIGAEGRTVAAFLHAAPSLREGSTRTAYLVDEASLLSARDMTRLLEKTQGDRVVLVGDVKQLGSIEAGAAFRQMQEHAALKTSVTVQAGDRITLREPIGHLKGGAVLTVERIDVGVLHLRDARGGAQTLNTAKAVALDYAYAQTAHQAQGSTCTCVLVHAESDRVNLMNQQSLYVALSRATHEAIVYTDDRAALAAQVTRTSGQKETALDAPSDRAPGSQHEAATIAPWEKAPSAEHVQGSAREVGGETAAHRSALDTSSDRGTPSAGADRSAGAELDGWGR